MFPVWRFRTVQCKDCGYLALRRKEVGGFHEADERFRWGFGAPWEDHLYHRRPHCFANIINFYWLLHREDSEYRNYSEVDAVKDIIVKPRKCRSFVRWQQGFNPKEHREMVDRATQVKWRILEVVIIPILLIGATIAGAFIARSR